MESRNSALGKRRSEIGKTDGAMKKTKHLACEYRRDVQGSEKLYKSFSNF